MNVPMLDARIELMRCVVRTELQVPPTDGTTGDARRFTRIHSSFTAAGAAVGAAVGYSQNDWGGAIDGALVGGHIGSFVGGLAAAGSVKCFVSGTLVWVPSDDKTLMALPVVLKRESRDGDEGLDATSSLGLILLATAGIGILALDNHAEREREKSRPKVPCRDAWFDDEDDRWMEDLFGIEELANDGERFCLN